MIRLVLVLDQALTQFINELIPHNQFFDLFFSFFSIIGNAALIWIVIVAFLIIFEEKRNHKFIISFIISIFITAVLVNVVIKNIVQRPRPTEKISNCPSDFSFPSGHASTAFAAATVLAVFDKRRRGFYYFVAIIISFSRIYLGCHYFLDVVAGGMIGCLISKLIVIKRKF